MTGDRSTYQHFCPAARALEVIGEKWTLLIVRDLLAGPRRFSELQRSLAAITPKWLSARLRELEAAGIIEREAANQREVWYKLTTKGQALAPVLHSLVDWGIEYVADAPRPDEAIHPGRATDGFLAYLNRRQVRPAAALIWSVRFPGDHGVTIVFDGRRWARQRTDSAADVIVETTPLEWVRFLTGNLEERRRWLATAQVVGSPAQIDQFAQLLGRQPPSVRRPADVAPVGEEVPA